MNRILITVATYNERANVSQLASRLSRLPVALDVLFVDDNSPDGTGLLVEDLARNQKFITVIHRPAKLGLTSALLEAFSWGLRHGHELILNLDADLSHQPEEIPHLVSAADSSEVVLGSRYLPSGRAENWSRQRLLLSKMAGRYIRWSVKLPFTDPTTGFRCYRREALSAILNHRILSKGFSVHFEMSYLSWLLQLRVKEVPISFVDREKGASKLNSAIIWEAFWLVWRLRLGHRQNVHQEF